jgi:hypothetical protein
MPDSDVPAQFRNWGQLIWASAPTTTTTPERYAAEVRLVDDRRIGAEIVPAKTH